MAQVTETAPEMTDEGGDKSGTTLAFTIVDRDDPAAVAVAQSNGRQSPNARARLFVVSSFPVFRSDGRPGGFRETAPTHVDSSNYPELVLLAFLQGLKHIRDTDKSSVGL